MRTPSGHKVYAMAAEYSSAAALYEAAKTCLTSPQRVEPSSRRFMMFMPRTYRRNHAACIREERGRHS